MDFTAGAPSCSAETTSRPPGTQIDQLRRESAYNRPAASFSHAIIGFQ
jgi:hypothetical protein